MRGLLVSFFVTAVAFIGCGTTSAPGGAGSGGGACSSSADCGAQVCVTLGSASTCAAKCSTTANECGGSAGCQGIGSVGINVCAPAPKMGDTPKASEQPRLPCKNDADCDVIHPGAICATFMGLRDCTIACTNDPPCTTPTIGGVSVDFYRCQTDQGNSARKACLPRAECENNPLACVTVPGAVGGSDSGLPGSEFDAGF